MSEFCSSKNYNKEKWGQRHKNQANWNTARYKLISGPGVFCWDIIIGDNGWEFNGSINKANLPIKYRFTSGFSKTQSSWVKKQKKKRSKKNRIRNDNLKNIECDNYYKPSGLDFAKNKKKSRTTCLICNMRQKCCITKCNKTICSICAWKITHTGWEDDDYTPCVPFQRIKNTLCPWCRQHIGKECYIII